MASMLDAYRLYLQAVARAYMDGHNLDPRQLDRLRIERTPGALQRRNLGGPPGRRAFRRSGASADRECRAGQFPSVHSRRHGAGSRIDFRPHTPMSPSRAFAHDLELTLYLLAARLRGSPLEPNALPDLREDHNRLDRSDALLLIEADRMTNSLNTLAEQIFRWRV